MSSETVQPLIITDPEEEPFLTTKSTSSSSSTTTSPLLPPDLISDVLEAYRVFVQSFSLAFGLRYGISSLLRLIQILRKGDFASVFSLNTLFSEKYLIVRVDAVRLGLAVGGFGSAYTLLTRLAARLRGKNDGFNNFFAGLLSGFSLLFLEKDSRRSVSLYVLGRVAEGIYYSLKSHGMWHFWGSDWNHGDTLLFSLASAQVMYAYVMRPETLDESYYKFIVRTGPIAGVVLNAVRASNRGIPVDVNAVMSYVSKLAPLNKVQINAHPPIIPCHILHPLHSSCSTNTAHVLLSSFKKILPLYATLTFVPMIFLKFSRFLKNPLEKLFTALVSTLRSTLFLSAFITFYNAVVCTQRKFVNKDHRIIYWVAGLVASLSILIEKKSRRAELALYALPRGVDSLYMLLLDRKWMASVPQGELLLFCFSMAGIMYFYEKEPNTMSPFFVGILDKITAKIKTQQNNITTVTKGGEKQTEEEQ